MALAASAVAASPPEEIVVELRVGRLARQTVLALMADDGIVLVPARPLFELVEIEAAIDAEGRLRAVREPRGIAIGADPVAGRAWVGNDVATQESAPMAVRGGELYLGAPLVARLLDLRAEVDLGELTVTLDPAEDLPVGRRVARERARAARGGAGAARPDRVVAPAPAGLHGAALDWSLAAPDLEQMEAASVEVGLGANLAGGALELRRRTTGRPLTGSWIGAWTEGRGLEGSGLRSLGVRQLRLGAVAGTGPRARALDGIAVSSSPFARPLAFGQIELGGWAGGPGWEVELRRDGELVDFALADERGFYRLAAPVDYGRNPVEVRAYGPHGEMRVLARAIPVSADRLPDGTLEVEASAGACPGGDCEGQGNLDLRYAPSRAWTVRAGTDAFVRAPLPSLVHPYAALSGAIRHDWLVRAEGVAGALGALELGYEPTPDLAASLSHTAFDRDTPSPVLTPAGAESQSRAALFWRPDRRRPGLYLQASAARAVAAGEAAVRTSLGASAQLANVRSAAEWREERSASRGRSEIGLAASTALRARGLPVLRGLFLRGTMDLDLRSGGVGRAGLLAGRNLGTIARLELGAAWSRAEGGLGVVLGLSASGFAFHSASRVVRAPGGAVSTGAFMEGGLVWNEAVGRLETAPGRASGRGGVSGTVFVDANANGWLDAGEEPVGGVRLRAGAHTAVTDSLGRYAAWDLGPFEAAEVALDPETLPNPLWVPGFVLASVAVEPNGFRQVDVPLVPGAEVTGRVVREGTAGAAGVGGVRVVLTHAPSGRRHEGLTFHDGAFYFLALPPGDYVISIPDEVLAVLGLRMAAPGPRFTAAGGAGGAGDRLGDFILRLVPASER